MKRILIGALILAAAATSLAAKPKRAAQAKEAQMKQAEGKIADKAEFDAANTFGQGLPNTAYAQYFIGNSFLNPLKIGGGESPINVANVTFEPGCRNNWHVHHATKGGGQVIICTAGSGWYQLEGQPAVSMKAGDIAYFPAGIKHWHGAAADSWFSHLAFELPGENTSNEWLEPVTDDVYSKLK